MSEQDEQIVETVQSTDQVRGIVEEVADRPRRPRRAPGWIAPAWFFFGVIVGAAAFALYTMFISRSAAAPNDAVTMRGAARQGVLDAIATLNAPGSQPSSQENQAPVVVDPSKFTVRAANRTGNSAAKVTVFEFSDFQ